MPDGVFSRQEAHLLGWSDPALSRAVESGRLARIRHGLFVAAPATDLDRAVAAARSCRGAHISHRSAALLFDLPLLYPTPSLPELTVTQSPTADLVDAHLYRAALPSEQIMVVDGLPVTTPARTLIDLGRHLPVSATVAAMDAVLNRGLVQLDELEAVRRFCVRWPGVRRAELALGLADGRAESPLESISRIEFVRMGLPTGTPQLEITDGLGRFVARVDFGWPEFGVVGEADGLMKYTDPEVLRAEKVRQERLEQLGFIVVRWSWDEITRHPETVRNRLQAAFARGKARDPRTSSPNSSV